MAIILTSFSPIVPLIDLTILYICSQIYMEAMFAFRVNLGMIFPSREVIKVVTLVNGLQ